MQIHSSARATSFSDLEMGSCFVFRFGDKTQIGIKISQEINGRDVPACALLWPGHPDLVQRPALIQGDAVTRSGPVVALPTALLIPSPDPAHAEIGTSQDLEPGLLILLGDRWILCVGTGHDGIAAFEIATGAAVNSIDPDAAVHVRSWRIVEKGPGDRYETICSFEIKRSAPFGFSAGR
jgi:hypothetical protein